VTHKAAEEAGIAAGLPVADDDILPFGGDIEDLEVYVHAVVKRVPDRLDIIEATISQNAVDPRVRGKQVAQRHHVEAIERLDIGSDDVLVGFRFHGFPSRL